MNISLDRFTCRVRAWLLSQSEKINHRGVIKDVFAEGEMSAGYIFSLNVANLIALCGLLVNSSPVIIGAMLISPLMGPFLSFGFAFVTGDGIIWSKAVRKIILSVTLSIVVAAFATYLSPLKELTGEIVSRTRPNLYDLIIAFLAGLAGASALCTKKNFLTVVPGVAIATAVIPPLSVVGFGLGTWNLRVFLGGFLLFFTNFVAIIISTCIVFYFYGFRRSMATEVELSQLKKRLAFLVTVLIVISIPLGYTLQRSISEVKLRNTIRDVLHARLDRANQSHLATFTYKVGSDDVLKIDAVVNTVRYLNEADARQVESALSSTLRQKVVLNLEQIKVQTGGLKELPRSQPPAIASLKPVVETPISPGEHLRTTVKRTEDRLAQVIIPARIAALSVGLRNYSAGGLAIRMKLQRDTPLTGDETAWLRRYLAADLGSEVQLTVETAPFVPLLAFRTGETILSEEMKKKMLKLRDVYQSDRSVTIQVEALPGRASSKERRLAAERLSGVADYLTTSCGVPRDRITTKIGPLRRKGAAVKISVLAE
ncbi:TIGR00341 family protein [Geomobilimonas luticola]|uniref:TIGR00341 family protein n=1 Tax=Geomobilimonas luticola TaxID=1114878 RepID=A0ABS5SE29_9BACT|nr:TIGR00341 family protein [Geomobilimonas luticola]MBT0653435.1 TIGR00341 family protein [Geomobilimonas luticola]